MTRHLIFLPVLLAVLALTACGGDDEIAGARVRVLTGEADGPLQGALQLQSLEEAEGRIYETRALGDNVYVAPGAPPGKYRVFSSADWGMLWSGRQGSSAPLLRGSDYPPAMVRLGKPRSLYVASGMPGRWTLSATWGAEWKRATEGDKAQFQPVELKVEDQGEDIFALRFPADVWAAGSVVRILGLMSDNTVTNMVSYQLRDGAHVQLPRMVLMLGATQAPLSVHLVPPPGVQQVPDGTPVRVTLEDVALAHTYEAQSFGGRARFDELAALGHGLRVELPGSGPEAVFRIDPGTWRMRQALHVVAVAPETRARALIEEIGGGYTDALVCHRGGTNFGRVSFERVPRGPGEERPKARLRTHPGVQEWWLKTVSGEWVYAVVDVPPAPGKIHVAVGRSQGRSAHIRGTVRGQRQGSRVVFRQVHEAREDEDGPVQLPERKLGGDGFEAAVSPQGGYEAFLPPGRYEIRVLGPGGSGGRPATLPLKAGSEFRFDPPPR